MAVRAASWAFLGALFVGAASAAERPTPPSTPAADSLPVATDARLGGDESQTRFVMDFSRKIDLHAFTLADPYRVVLDIPQVMFQLPPKAGESGRGLIKAFRFGLVMQGGSRMVFDLAKPVRIDKAFVVDAADGAPARLVLDLAADRSRELFAQDRARQQVEPRRFAARRAGRPQRAAIRARSSCSIPAMAASTPAPRARAARKKRTSFSISPSACATASKRPANTGCSMTRTDDTFMPLAERVRIARNAGAALFVSIHADSLPHREGDAQGASVYTLSETASDSEAAQLAEKENRADVIAGVDLKSEPDDVAGILIDLAQRETKSLFDAVRA